MNDQDLIKKIKKLKKVGPSQEWLLSARHNLVNRVRLSDNANDFCKETLGFWGRFRQYQAAALATCLLLNILVGPWLITKASQSSLPGDLLYAIKRAGEGIQTRVASEENAGQLQVEFANRRIEELNKIAQKFATKDTKETEAETNKVISGLRNNLTEASQRLNNISKEKAVIVAKQTKKINDDLIKAKEGVSEEARAGLAEAEKAIEDIKFQILAVLMGGDEETEIATSSDEEILIFLKGEEDGRNATTTEYEIGPENQE